MVNEFVSLVVLSKAEECADEGARGELVPLLFRDMHECSRPEDADIRDVWLVPAPRFFRCHTVPSLHWSDVVDVCCVMKGVTVVPISFVYCFGHTVCQWLIIVAKSDIEVCRKRVWWVLRGKQVSWTIASAGAALLQLRNDNSRLG